MLDSRLAPVLRAAQQTTSADLVVDYLAQLGVEWVFGVPGGSIEPLFDALARSGRTGGPQLVVARHEGGAAFMADGYHRETGRMGVVCSTTGPGATNLITGVSSAMADHVPMLVITAQTALPKFGRRAMQESSCTAIDTVAMMRHCTVFSSLVSHAEQLESKLISAIMAAHRSPNGPAHLSIPSDVLAAASAPPQRIHADLFAHDFKIADDRAIEILWRKILKVDTIAVFIDGEIGPAAEQVLAFCERVNAPFVVGQTGKYWVDERHPLYRGVYGFAGHSSARALFSEGRPDLILAVGSALTELATGGWDAHLLNTRLVHIDQNAEHFTRSPMANHHVCSDPGLVFGKLNQLAKDALVCGKRWYSCVEREVPVNCLGTCATLETPERCRDVSAPIKPQRLMAVLNRVLPPDTRIYLDAGNIWAWFTHYFVNTNFRGQVRIGAGFGSMCWGVAAAVGSARANPDVLTVCLVGDGAYLMSAQEITVAAQHGLPVVFIVLNDSALGMVLHGQRMGGAESIGWELNRVNFAMQAQSIGVPGIVVHSAAQLEEIDFNAFLALRSPVLLDVRIDREETPPITQRIHDLGNAARR
ncbi:MAG: thiamine pyrophosphate-binding protein [Cellvibrionaceae bacterium]|nr:thiamine pyrophosphate-binding protein [Cellvibrionaceae bacterium]